MAEEQYTRLEHFGEFMKRMDERFDHVNKLPTSVSSPSKSAWNRALLMPKRRGNKIMFTSTGVWMA